MTLTRHYHDLLSSESLSIIALLIRKPDSSFALGLIVDDYIALLKHFSYVSVRFFRRSANEVIMCVLGQLIIYMAQGCDLLPLFLDSVISVERSY